MPNPAYVENLDLGSDGTLEEVVVLKTNTPNNKDVLLWEVMSRTQRQIFVDMIDMYGGSVTAIDVNPYILFDFQGTLAAGDPTGLTYTRGFLTISADGEDRTFSPTPASVSTWGDFLTELVTATTDIANSSIVDGNLRIDIDDEAGYTTLELIADRLTPYCFQKKPTFTRIVRKATSIDDVLDGYYVTPSKTAREYFSPYIVNTKNKGLYDYGKLTTGLIDELRDNGVSFGKTAFRTLEFEDSLATFGVDNLDLKGTVEKSTVDFWNTDNGSGVEQFVPSVRSRHLQMTVKDSMDVPHEDGYGFRNIYNTDSEIRIPANETFDSAGKTVKLHDTFSGIYVDSGATGDIDELSVSTAFLQDMGSSINYTAVKARYTFLRLDGSGTVDNVIADHLLLNTRYGTMPTAGNVYGRFTEVHWNKDLLTSFSAFKIVGDYVKLGTIKSDQPSNVTIYGYYMDRGTVPANKVNNRFDGEIFMLPDLPTADPAKAGALWNNAGVINISAG